MRSLRRVLLAALVWPAFALAQDATNGASLFNAAVVSGKQSCSNSACHGKLPANPQNHISNGIDAAKIKASIGAQSQMAFLRGRLTDPQLNDLAAYVAGTLGGAPSYLNVPPAPRPAVSPTQLSFASQPIGLVSPVQTVMVSNGASATAALVLGNITTTAGGDFDVSGGTCTAALSLAAGASCSVAITFRPTVAGTRSSTLTVAHSGAGGASTVALSGAGGDTSPTLTLAPTQLSFTQTVGATSEPLRVVVGNTGGAALVFGSIAITGPNAADFAISASSTCSTGTAVSSGSNCAIDVVFAPGATGARIATLALQHNAGSGASTVALAGQGNAGATAGLALDATQIDLGTQALGLVGAPRTLTVTNNGQADLQFSAIAVSGVQAAEIVLGGNCAVGAAVVPKASCAITLALQPAGLGTRNATLDITSNGQSGTASITLTGEAVATPAPFLTLSQAALGFGRVSIGSTSVVRQVRLSNSGSDVLAFTSVQSSSTEFAVSHDCPTRLAAGGACTISVAYTPTAPNAAESVVITSNAFSSPNSIVLTGIGASSPLPVLAWTGNPNALAFGSVVVGAAGTGQTLALVNQGPGTATVSAFGLAGANPEAFSVGGGSCTGGIVLAVGASCTVVVSFVPDAAGERVAALLVASNGSNPPDIGLTGSGSASTNTSDGSAGGTGSGTGSGSGSIGNGSATPLRADRAQVDFRAIVVRTGGRSEPLSVRITNGASTTTTVMAVSTTGGFSVQPSTSADACQGVPWTLPPGTSCTVDVVFTPAEGGAASGKLQVLSQDGSALEVPLTAEAQTQMTNVGGGAMSVAWSALLALAALLLGVGRRDRTHHFKESI